MTHTSSEKRAAGGTEPEPRSEHRQTRVELYVRNHTQVVETSQRTLVADLERLADVGAIDEFTVDTWGRCIEEEPGDLPNGTARAAWEKVTEFEAWADRQDTTLEPWFQRREQGSLITDTTREVIVPPIACLAVYEGNELQEVHPHAGDPGHRCVHEYVATLDAIEE